MEAVDWDMVEEALVWVEAMEVVVEGMVSQQEVEVMEAEWCTEEGWAGVPRPW